MVFGKKKQIDEQKAKQASHEEPDLVINNPNVPDIEQKVGTAPLQPQNQGYVGMPGFVPDQQPRQQAPQPVQQPVPQPMPQAPVAQPVEEPAEPEIKEQYQIVAAELVGQGIYKYVIITNRNLGEVGEVYDL